MNKYMKKKGKVKDGNSNETVGVKPLVPNPNRKSTSFITNQKQSSKVKKLSSKDRDPTMSTKEMVQMFNHAEYKKVQEQEKELMRAEIEALRSELEEFKLVQEKQKLKSQRSYQEEQELEELNEELKDILELESVLAIQLPDVESLVEAKVEANNQ
eukprot:Awhi_evm1s10796